MKIAVIIAAAGSSTRMGGGRSKCLRELQGRPVLAHSLRLFMADADVAAIALAVREDDRAEIEKLAQQCRKDMAADGHIFSSCPAADTNSAPKLFTVPGGADRTASVTAALQAISAIPVDFIAVHDGARPLLSRSDWQALKAAAAAYGAAIPAVRPVDSIKQVREADEQGAFAAAAFPRERLALVQTPQVFAADTLRRAYRRAEMQGLSATDDCALVQELGVQPRLVWMRDDNFKLTYEQDLCKAEAVLAGRKDVFMQAAAKSGGLPLRIGQGWDSHRLVEGRPLILGATEIASPVGLLGHSDGDVLLHAIIDALLGAAALPDIGRQFPDSDPAYKGANSARLLRRTCELLDDAGWRPAQVDATVIAERPRLAPHIDTMRAAIAELLGLPMNCVSLKAKTAEKLDSVGRGEAMQAQAVVLCERSCP